MIFYFSATGNSKSVAEQLASATQEDAISITECLKTDQFIFELADNERLGFVTPTYFWGLPITVLDFIDKMDIRPSGQHYVYHVLTYGTTTGQAHLLMEKRLSKRGLSLHGKFTVRMVDTWTPVFDLSDAEENARVTNEAEPLIVETVEKVQERVPGDFAGQKLPRPIVAAYYATYRTGRTTSKFTADDSCVSCGLCAKQCPVEAIEMRQGKPVWTKDRCAVCLGCLHRCPKFAIQYGCRTKSHGQFVNPNVKL